MDSITKSVKSGLGCVHDCNLVQYYHSILLEFVRVCYTIAKGILLNKIAILHKNIAVLRDNIATLLATKHRIRL